MCIHSNHIIARTLIRAQNITKRLLCKLLQMVASQLVTRQPHICHVQPAETSLRFWKERHLPMLWLRKSYSRWLVIFQSVSKGQHFITFLSFLQHCRSSSTTFGPKSANIINISGGLDPPHEIRAEVNGLFGVSGDQVLNQRLAGNMNKDDSRMGAMGAMVKQRPQKTLQQLPFQRAGRCFLTPTVHPEYI